MSPSQDDPPRWTGPAVALSYAVVLVAVGLRYHVIGDGESETDFFGAYVVQARALLDGVVVIDPYRGPLYPIALALLGLVLRPLGAGLFETGIVLSAVSGAAALALSHRLFARLFGGRVALGATLLVAFNPLFVRYSYTTGNDMFFVALAMVAVATVVEVQRPSWRRAVFAGVALGFAYLTRYNGAVILLAAVVCVLFVNVWETSWKKRLSAVAMIVAVFAALITPWGLYCLDQRGEFFSNQNYLNVAYSMLPQGMSPDQAQQIDYDALHGYADVFRAASARQLAGIPLRAYGHFVSAMGGAMRWPVGVFVILGLVALVLRRATRRQAAYYLFALIFFASLLFVFYNDRFGLFVVPACAVLAVDGIARLSRTRTAAAIAVAILIGYGAFASVQANRVIISIGDERVREMGEWFVRNVPEELRHARVVARKPAFAYFAGLEPAPLPVLRSHQELLDYLDRRNAHYLFYGEMGWRTRPQLSYLTETRRQHPGLELVYATRAGALYRVVR